MSSNLDMLIEERKFAQEAGDMDKVMEIDAMIQLHFGNQPQEGEKEAQRVEKCLKRKRRKLKTLCVGQEPRLEGLSFPEFSSV